ncbi:4'-phosphopantetheinyl transferase superfamily protein [uncultured Pontibacter sp.]|uniref:4'-phosphopantetheinyl transferase superfamily protein n=1 Tax=uncultured Pontibacter sp. TaxID=453356 RepID=UPI0026183351|nr:4'-phosphopantetheinyl transferase superfamily protein [uncultured Pontibacter sp.]
MPLLQIKQLNPHTALGIWQTDEPVEELLRLLPTFVDCTQVERVHQRRKREWLASRVLVYRMLEQFTTSPAVLRKNENGKPYFENEPFHVSISHSPYLAAAIISDKFEVGIDIELLSQKALRVADKFLSEAEKIFTAQNEAQTCLYWSAKETLYKLYSRKQLIFKDNLILKPCEDQNVLDGQVFTANLSKLYRVNFEYLQNHVLTYCLDDLQA